MAKTIYKGDIKARLTSDKLNKIGGIRFYDQNKGTSKIYRGADLKKALIDKGFGGKTNTKIEKILKEEYGVSGSQLAKRRQLMESLDNKKNKPVLTPKQILAQRKAFEDMERDKNLRARMQRTAGSLVGRLGRLKMEEMGRLTEEQILGKVGGVKGDASRIGVSQGSGSSTVSIASAKPRVKDAGKTAVSGTGRLGGEPPAIKMAA